MTKHDNMITYTRRLDKPGDIADGLRPEQKNDMIKNVNNIIPERGTEIGNWPFGTSLTNIIIPEGVTKIGVGAFYECSSLKNITLPESVTEIGRYAFYRCTSLNNIIIPDGVTEIGRGAFEGCSSLTSVIIPESVTEIGNWTFTGCTSLKKVSLPKKVKLGNDVFFGCHTDLKIEYRD